MTEPAADADEAQQQQTDQAGQAVDDDGLSATDADEQPQSATDSGESDADYWKRRARENEDRAKSNHRELEKLRRESMSEQERAIAEAKDEARAEALREVSGRVVDAEVRSAAANRPINVDALLAGLDRSQFLDDGGDVDRNAITSWLDQVAPAQQPQPVDMAQGARGSTRSSPDEVFGELITNSLSR